MLKRGAAGSFLPIYTASCSSGMAFLHDVDDCTNCVKSVLATAPRRTPLSSLLFVKQKNRGAFGFAEHTNVRENKSQEVALNAPVSAGHAGDRSV